VPNSRSWVNFNVSSYIYEIVFEAVNSILNYAIAPPEQN